MPDVFTQAALMLDELADNAPHEEISAAATELHSDHRIFCTGIGKSGLVAHKLAVSLSAHGVAAHFVHPVEALHGDMGVLRPVDAIVAVSASGNTRELADFTAAVQRPFDVGIYGGKGDGILAARTKVIIPTWVGANDDECTNFVPSMSFVAAIVCADALALEVARLHKAPGLAATHPGGHLGATEPWA